MKNLIKHFFFFVIFFSINEFSISKEGLNFQLNIPSSYSLILERDIFLQESTLKNTKSEVKYFQKDKKWRFELWQIIEGEKHLRILQIFDGLTYALWMPESGVITITKDNSKLYLYPTVFMENFALFAFLTKRGYNVDYCINTVMPVEIANENLWESIQEEMSTSLDKEWIQFPAFTAKYSGSTYFYKVEFFNQNKFNPVSIQKYNENSEKVSEVRIKSNDRLWGVIPERITLSGFQNNKEIMKGEVRVVSISEITDFKDSFFQIDYSLAKEIIDIDNEVSIPLE